MMRARFAYWLLTAALVAAQPPAIAQTSASDPEVQHFVKVIDALRRGATQYPDMEAPMARELAQQAPIFTPILMRLGPLESVNLLRTQQGERVYEVWFVNGRMIWGVTESATGRIAGMRAE